jgi:hypothetical protein
VAKYGAETWAVTLVAKNALRIFERKMIGRRYGSPMENNM